MSTAKSSDDGTKKPPKSSSDKGPGKKNKSKGFIESSDFKPSWLETGPLPADVLSSIPDPALSDSMAEELAALQEALQRYYGDVTTPDAADTPAPAASQPDTLRPPTEEATVEPPPAPEASPDVAAPAEPLAPVVEPGLEELLAELEGEEAHLDAEWAAEDPLAALWSDARPQRAPAIEPPPVETAVLTPAPPAEEAAIAAEQAADEDVTVAEPAVADVGHADVGHADVGHADVDHADGGHAAAVYDDASHTDAAHEGLAPEEAEAVDEGDEWSTPFIEAETEPEDAPLPDFFVVEPEATAEALPAAAPEPRRKSKRVRAPRRERPVRRPSRLSGALLTISLLLLAAAAVIYFVNPFTRVAMWLGSLARPVSSPTIAPPSAADAGGWCVQGDFLTGDALPRLVDDGTQGDVLADDAVYALDYPIAQPGSYNWQVVDCADPARAFPAGASWIVTDQPNQSVTFVFDSDERADRLFFPIPYAVSALDSAQDYHVIGSFQDWIVDDASARLEPLGSGLYQQVRRIARSGNYESYVIVGDAERAIDAYGRTTEPIPFSFDTDRNGEYVIFLVDVDRGRASVMYDMPPLLTRLAFGGGHLLLSAALAAVAVFLLLWLLLRELILRNSGLWMESGCPRCHEQELMRISRRTKDRLLHVLGIPAYRYRCRNCTWEGTRLSEAGRSVSPGATIARIEGMR